VVLGTAAFLEPELLDELLARHGEAIAVGLDAREGHVAVHGWQEQTGQSPADAAARLSDAGVATIIYTNVDRDGTMQGADREIAEKMIEAANGARVIYSGGVGSLQDLRALAGLDLEGVIVGKALYESRFTVQEAMEAL
jgi:phosphoribosylformimino-5-aminoimidazole carboxamide ribotide isomerase